MSDERDRCGWMREGGDGQCVYSEGHSGLHQWGPLPARAFVDEEDATDYEEGPQEMPPMPSDSGCKV